MSSLSMSRQKLKKIGVVLGPILFFIILVLPINSAENNSSDNNANNADLSLSAKLVLATTFWMAAWWVTEAIPIYVTALLPLILFPSLSITELGQTAANYADRIIFLFLGGFILAKAIEKTQLHRRFALNILNVFGTNPKYIVAAFMLVTGILSAWMSNTATTMLMLPIAGAVISQIGRGRTTSTNSNNNSDKNNNLHHYNNSDDKNSQNIENLDNYKSKDKSDNSRFGLCLMLSIAYSASIGGMATLIGTPPNAIFASLSKSMIDTNISFGEWLLIGFPISGISLVIAWIYMVNIGVKITDIKSVHKGKEMIKRKLTQLGNITKDEKVVAGVFAGTATAWITRGLIWGDYMPMVDDSTIAISAAFLLFLIPSRSKAKQRRLSSPPSNFLSASSSKEKNYGNNSVSSKKAGRYDYSNDDTKNKTNGNGKILDWKTAVTIPWGVLLLIGGGLALANAFTITGLDVWISNQLVFVENLNYFLIVLVIVAVGVLSSEIISNTATAALLIPVVVSLASSISINPLLLMIPLTLATSYGFIMPVGTPPNAIVYGSGYVTAPKMAKAGFPLDLIGILTVTLLATLLVPLVWGE